MIKKKKMGKYFVLIFYPYPLVWEYYDEIGTAFIINKR